MGVVHGEQTNHEIKGKQILSVWRTKEEKKTKQTGPTSSVIHLEKQKKTEAIPGKKWLN